MPLRAVVITHELNEGPARMEPLLLSAGFHLEQRFRSVAPEDRTASLVVVMGGPMGVSDAGRFPFLGTEMDLLRHRISDQRPTLGICLGAQLLAAAAGGPVYAGGKGLELGAFPIFLTAAGSEDPVFEVLESGAPVIHWHADTFDPVPGAASLASSSMYAEQAFRLGNSYGIQFHPEIEAESFERWIRSVPEEVARSGRSMDEIVATDVPLLRQGQPSADRLLVRLVDHFARTCLER